MPFEVRNKQKATHWLASSSRMKPEIWYKYFYEKPKSWEERFTHIQLPRVNRRFV